MAKSFAKFFERRCRCRFESLALRQLSESQKSGDGAAKNVRKLRGRSVSHFNMFLCHRPEGSWMVEVAERIGNPGRVIGWTKGSSFRESRQKRGTAECPRSPRGLGRAEESKLDSTRAISIIQTARSGGRQ